MENDSDPLDKLITTDSGKNGNNFEKVDLVLNQYGLMDLPNPPLYFVQKVALWFDIPVTPKMFFTIRGSENFHIYLWIAKDYSWSQDLYYESLIFGIAALAWCSVLMYHAVRTRNNEEIFFLIPLTIWLFGNFWWMTGEIVNEDDDVRQPQAGDIMLSGMAIFALYWICLRPLNLLLVDINRAQKYNEVGLKPRFKIFYSWRQYEVCHRYLYMVHIYTVY